MGVVERFIERFEVVLVLKKCGLVLVFIVVFFI